MPYIYHMKLAIEGPAPTYPPGPLRDSPNPPHKIAAPSLEWSDDMEAGATPDFHGMLAKTLIDPESVGTPGIEQVSHFEHPDPMGGDHSQFPRSEYTNWVYRNEHGQPTGILNLYHPFLKTDEEGNTMPGPGFGDKAWQIHDSCVAVHPDHRRQGIAGQLIDHVNALGWDYDHWHEDPHARQRRFTPGGRALFESRPSREATQTPPKALRQAKEGEHTSEASQGLRTASVEGFPTYEHGGEWRFGSSNVYNWKVVESDFDPANTFFQGDGWVDAPDRSDARVVVGHIPSSTVYVGQPGSHHADIIDHHNLSISPVDPIYPEEWSSEGAADHHDMYYGMITDKQGYQGWGPGHEEIKKALHKHGLLSQPDGSVHTDLSNPSSDWVFSKAAARDNSFLFGGFGKFIVTPEGVVYSWNVQNEDDQPSHDAFATSHPEIDEEAMGNDLWSAAPTWTLGWIGKDGSITSVDDAVNRDRDMKLVERMCAGTFIPKEDEGEYTFAHFGAASSDKLNYVKGKPGLGGFRDDGTALWTHIGHGEIENKVFEHYPQYAPADSDPWHFAKTADVYPEHTRQHAPNWKPGTWGKGILFRDGSVHTWNTYAPEGQPDGDGFPFHVDYIMNELGNKPPAKPEQMFAIQPNGETTASEMHMAHINDADPLLKPGGHRWKFAATLDPWEPGSLGKGLLYYTPASGTKLVTWKVNTVMNPDDPGLHHHDVAEMLGLGSGSILAWINSISKDGEYQWFNQDNNPRPDEIIQKLDLRLKKSEESTWTFGKVAGPEEDSGLVGFKWVWDKHEEIGYALPMPTYHSTVENLAKHEGDMEMSALPQYGVIGPEGEVEWYGGGTPGPAQLAWLKTIDPRAHLVKDYYSNMDDPDSFGWAFSKVANREYNVIESDVNPEDSWMNKTAWAYTHSPFIVHDDFGAISHQGVIPPDALDLYTSERKRRVRGKTSGEDHAMLSDVIAIAYEKAMTDGGVTIDLEGFIPASGFAVPPDKTTEEKVPLDEFTVTHIEDYIDRHLTALQAKGNFFGIWVAVDKEDGVNKAWMDVSQVCNDELEAQAIGRRSEQEAIFDLATYTEIPVDHTEQPNPFSLIPKQDALAALQAPSDGMKPAIARRVAKPAIKLKRALLSWRQNASK